MKFFENINNVTFKVAKGMIAIFTIKLILFLGVFIFQSCTSDKESLIENEQNKSDFFISLNTSMKNINSVKLNRIPKGNFMHSKVSSSDDGSFIYLAYEDGTLHDSEDFEHIDNLNDLVIIQNDYDLILSTNYQEIIDNDLNELHTYQVQTEPIISALQPSVIQAKEYLYNKGLTEQDIYDIIAEENGTELDLVPLVMHMANIEKTGEVALDFSDIFISKAYAQTSDDFIRCGAVAIGADILYALATQDSAKWTRKAMGKAFGAVAKRALGPIGVAIAVVSFGVCLAEAS